MRKRSKAQEDRDSLRREIMGLGDGVGHKSYYPELRQRLSQLEHFRGLLDKASDLILVIDRESGRVIDQNRAARLQLGYDETGDPAVTFARIAPDLDAAVRSAEADRDHGEQTAATTTLRRKDGSQFPAEVSFQWSELGGQSHGLIVARDITERLAAERALRESEERYRVLFEAMTSGFLLHEMIYDEAGKPVDFRFLDANPAFERILGIPFADIAGKHMSERTPDQTEDMVRRFSRVVETGAPLRLEHHLEAENKYLDVMAFKVRDKQFATLLTDITDRKTAEIALQQSEMRYRVLIDSAPVPILVHTDREIIFINALAISALGGTSVADFMDLPLGTFFLPGDRPTALDDAPSASSENRPDSFEERTLLRLDGTEFLAEASTVAIDFEGQRAVQVVFHDITERRDAEEANRVLRDELAHVARVSAMGEMAAGFAHELNQPLTAISNYAVGALRRINSRQMAAKDIERVLELVSDQARRAGEIIRRIRKLVAKGTTDQATVDLNEAIAETVHLLNGEALRNQVSMNLELQDDLPPVVGDSIQIQQVVLNLARNAIEAMGGSEAETRDLTIHTRTDGADTVLVEIADTGPGLSPVVRKHLFDPFFTTKQDGMGMGLSICRSIIQAHGGELAVGSDEGSGTVFTFGLRTAPADG